MDAFPLQSELIDAVIDFANADLDHPTQIFDYFKGTWAPDSIPQLRTCRTIRDDVRLWLISAATRMANREYEDAVLGLEDNYNRSFRRVDPGIRMEGGVSIQNVPVLGGHKEQIVWKWEIKNASLRAVCGLAVATIVQEQLHRRLGMCDREGCLGIFLDRSSRGIPRKYCKSTKCEKILNRERVNESRRKARI